MAAHGDEVADHPFDATSSGEAADRRIGRRRFAVAAVIMGIDMIAARRHRLGKGAIAFRMFGEAMRYQQDAAGRTSSFSMVISQRRPHYGELLRFSKHMDPPCGNRPDCLIKATWGFGLSDNKIRRCCDSGLRPFELRAYLFPYCSFGG